MCYCLLKGSEVHSSTVGLSAVRRHQSSAMIWSMKLVRHPRLVAKILLAFIRQIPECETPQADPECIRHLLATGCARRAYSARVGECTRHPSDKAKPDLRIADEASMARFGHLDTRAMEVSSTESTGLARWL